MLVPPQAFDGEKWPASFNCSYRTMETELEQQEEETTFSNTDTNGNKPVFHTLPVHCFFCSVKRC